ncbi:MAG: glycosyltransferase [Candidatus Latescibacteria bacterium]|nr:glycosyltransferase [Candidatus Latescibacterota bacterium]
MRRFAERAASRFVKGYATLQARRLHRYEAGMCARFARCLVVTEVDGRALRQMAPDARIEVIPSGVDTEWFDPALVPSSGSPEPHRLVTTGDYSWPPTADGLEDFVFRVYPLIRRAVPDVTLSVVGHRPPASVVRTAAQTGITVLGRVEDVRPAVLSGAVFVVPTRIGSGIRLKILEAMALRRPVVSTSVGCEGIEATPGEHLLVADDPEGFVGHVVQLLGDPALGQRLAAAAARLIERRYAWTAIADRLNEVYRTVVSER